MKKRKIIDGFRSAAALKRLSVIVCAVFFLFAAGCGEPDPPAERESGVSAFKIRNAGPEFTHAYTLDKVQKKMYDTLARSMESPSDEILIYEYKGDHMDFLLKDALVAMTSYIMDNPLDSQILANTDIRIGKVPHGGRRRRICAYRRDSSDELDIALLKRDDAETVGSNFAASIADLSDEEKLKAIHDRLCRGIYDMDIKEGSHTVYSALIDKEAVCDGYAYAFKYLCDLSGIGCVVVIGTFDRSLDDDPGHAWNLVWYDDSWKLVDISCDVYDVAEGYDLLSYRHFLSDDLNMYGRIPYSSYRVPFYREYQE